MKKTIIKIELTDVEWSAILVLARTADPTAASVKYGTEKSILEKVQRTIANYVGTLDGATDIEIVKELP